MYYVSPAFPAATIYKIRRPAGVGGFFPLTRQKVFLRLRLGGWMTRKVIGDF